MFVLVLLFDIGRLTIVVKHYGQCPWLDTQMAIEVLNLASAVATIDKTVRTLIYITLGAGYSIASEQLSKGQVKQVIFICIAEYVLSSIDILMLPNMSADSQLICRVLRVVLNAFSLLLIVYNFVANREHLRVRMIQAQRRQIDGLMNNIRRRIELLKAFSQVIGVYYLNETFFSLSLILGREVYDEQMTRKLLHEIYNLVIAAIVAFLLMRIKMPLDDQFLRRMLCLAEDPLPEFSDDVSEELALPEIYVLNFDEFRTDCEVVSAHIQNGSKLGNADLHFKELSNEECMCEPTVVINPQESYIEEAIRARTMQMTAWEA